ncbi:MAG: adenylosuccinate synthetase, partial [Anaerolineales bacterium]|nr:adenylosuccinate synthetase [Anaerolineales bacterium]
RRCGWLDLVLLRYSARVNGLTDLVITKLDILTGLDPLRVCTAYRYQGKRMDHLPYGLNAIGESEPIYTDIDGWTSDITTVKTPQALPSEARKYLELIQEEVGVPIALASVGPEREQAIRFVDL